MILRYKPSNGDYNLKQKTVIHQLSLVGIGGVQTSFLPYIKKAAEKSQYKHEIFSNYDIDSVYDDLPCSFYNLKYFASKIKFILGLISKNHIVHFYNNIGSQKLWLLLRFIPSSNIIFHERGASWNIPQSKKKYILQNAHKARLILANSVASKQLLIQKFGVDEEKIKVLYNGFLGDHIAKPVVESFPSKNTIGYLGRLDSPKGVEIFIEAAKKLPGYTFKIAGAGPLENYLKDKARDHENIEFVGRVDNPYLFLSKINILVVPSIREPLGNIIIEAGYMKKPVIASCVDGIPEILTHDETGILIQPKNSLPPKQKEGLSHPEFVVNGVTKKVQKPKAIDSEELAKSIKSLVNNEQKQMNLSNNLFNLVTKNNTLQVYFESLEKHYKNIIH